MPLGIYSRRHREKDIQRPVSADSQGNLPQLQIRGTTVELGDGAVASGATSVALLGSATGAESIAIGNGSSASAANAVALGDGITNAVATSVNIGSSGTNYLVMGPASAVSSQQLFVESTDNDYTTGAAAVATAQGPYAILDVNAGGAGNVLLATGAALDAAFPNLVVGSSWLWFVQNNLGGAAAATLTASAGHTIDADSTAAIADQITAGILTRRTAAATFISRVVTRGTH